MLTVLTVDRVDDSTSEPKLFVRCQIPIECFDGRSDFTPSYQMYEDLGKSLVHGVLATMLAQQGLND